MYVMYIIIFSVHSMEKHPEPVLAKFSLSHSNIIMILSRSLQKLRKSFSAFLRTARSGVRRLL